MNCSDDHPDVYEGKAIKELFCFMFVSVFSPESLIFRFPTDVHPEVRKTPFK